jgi:hypothetical protein
VPVLGLGLLSVRLRQLEAVTLVVIAGTSAGALLVLYPLQVVLYTVWQAAVAAAIAWQFTRPAPPEL